MGGTEGRGSIEVRMTDNPAEFTAVNVDIRRVEIHRGNGDYATGWRVINDEPLQVNLLDLVNGADTLIGIRDLGPGTYGQLRMVLGPQNSVEVNGEVHPLVVPSGQQSGLKLNINALIESGMTYTMLLDFDAARSVVSAGNGMYLLMPVIREVNLATSGSIQGWVEPAESAGLIYVVANGDTISTYADDHGRFRLIGIPDGSYRLTATSRADAFQNLMIDEVAVVPGEVTDIGSVRLR